MSMTMKIRKSGVSEAVENLKAALAANVSWEVDFLDAKRLNDETVRYRREALKLIKEIKKWRKEYGKRRDIHDVVYYGLQGKILFNHFLEVYGAYKDVRAEAKMLTDAYIKQHSNPRVYKG